MRIAFKLSCQAAAVALAIAAGPCLSALADDVATDTNKTVLGTKDTSTGPSASDKEVAANIKNPDLWPSAGRDLGLQRHSDLKAISTKNIGQLQMVWSQSTGALRGHEGQPVVVDVDGKPMMFFVSAWPNIVQALDLTDPDNPVAVWSYKKDTDRDLSAVPRACCDVVQRGVNYANGHVLLNTLDGYLISLDAKTGKETWVVKHAYPEHGETVTSAPMIADDKVVVGFGGDEFAARGRLEAYNLSDGKLLWRCQSNGTDKDVCLTPDTNKANPQHGTAGHDIGLSSYPGDEWKRGGGSPWAWISYDPELKLVYSSTGNPGNWSPTTRCKFDTHEKCNEGEQDNKWSMTVFARKIDTGEVVWAYQWTPFDQWDYDGVNENILVDMPNVDGKPRKTLVHFDRNGFAYVLDRTDGTLLRAHKFVTVNWAEKVDLKTGRPVKVPEHSPFKIGVNTQACPSAMGGKDQQPGSVDPKDPTKFYMPTNNWCMEDEPQARTHTQQGTVYVFANVYMYPEKPGIMGRLKKFDVLTGKTDWDIPDPLSELGRYAEHRRRPRLLRLAQRRLPRRRPHLRQGPVAAQARLGHPRQPDRLQAEGPRVRVGVRRYRRLDRSAGGGGSRSRRQVRRDRLDGADQGRRVQQDPAGRHALYLPRAG